MVSSITEYISYYEAGEDMTDEEYGIYMRAIHNFAYKDIEPDYSKLPPLVKAALRTVIASVRKNKEDRENGAKGGRPSRVISEEKPRFFENKNPGYEKTETNVNENVNENEKENVNTQACVREEPHGIGKIQKQCFEMVQEHNKDAPRERKIPCSNNFISFMQKEMRELIGAVGTEEPPEKIIAALQNYIKVAQSDTWQKTFSWRSFCKNYQNFSPEYFSLTKYLITEPETEDATQKPEYKFFLKMRTNALFHVETFQNHIADWKAAGRPEGAAYMQLQNKWEEEKCS